MVSRAVLDTGGVKYGLSSLEALLVATLTHAFWSTSISRSLLGNWREAETSRKHTESLVSQPTKPLGHAKQAFFSILVVIHIRWAQCSLEHCQSTQELDVTVLVCLHGFLRIVPVPCAVRLSTHHGLTVYCRTLHNGVPRNGEGGARLSRLQARL